MAKKKPKVGETRFLHFLDYLFYFIGLNCSKKNRFGLAFVIITTTLTLV